MTIYAQNDLCATNVSPEGHGGCGTPGGHRRPVEHGAPVKLWALDCAACEDHLRHDPMWSVTTTEVPETYDETLAREKAEKSGKLDRENQLAAAIIELGKLGQLPEALGHVLAPMLGGAPAALVGTTVCQLGHDNAAGHRFCAECGQPMSTTVAKAALPAAQKAAEPPAEPSGDRKPKRLRDATLATLQALARAHGLTDDGTRAGLIGRLSDAGVTSKALDALPVAA